MSAPALRGSSQPSNWWTDDPGARTSVERQLGDGAVEFAKRFEAAGLRVAEELPPLSAIADRMRPRLRSFDAYGNRIDAIDYHPAYHEIRRIARELGIVASAYGPKPAPRVATFGLGYLFGQGEAGYFCPVCLTDGTAYVLSRHAPEQIRRAFVPKLASSSLDGAFEGAMFLTERDGGSDVGAGTQTVARPAADGTWRLDGAKWFCSNADADLALTLARMPGGVPGTRGLGLFLLPRALPDGGPNRGIRIERLKDKLGVASMASGEITLTDAFAYLVAEPPAGFRAMAEMLNLSRLYNAVASVAVGRAAVRHVRDEGHRRVTFGRPLRDHALWRRRSVELAIEVESAVGLVFEACALMDASARHPDAAAALRALTPIVKAGTGRRAVPWASAACEALGGNGYIEDFPTARLLRDAQVLPIWEGTTNVLALDLLRAADEGALAKLLDHLETLAGSDAEGAPAREALRAARALETELAADGSSGAQREGREARSFDLLESTYHAATSATLVADARFDRAQGRKRKGRVLALLLAGPTEKATPEAYECLVEGKGA